jgi:Glyoxalase/Bleomycin resistance protein/Dioxygenase superfamily
MIVHVRFIGSSTVNVTAGGKHMKIKLTSVYVDDQDKALQFYTEVLGLREKGGLFAGTIPLADGGLGRGA